MRKLSVRLRPRPAPREALAPGSGACALRPQPEAPSRPGTSGTPGAVPGRVAARGNRAAVAGRRQRGAAGS